MSTFYLPPEIVELIAEETDKETLSSFILVCTDWKWPAKKRIWRSIKLSSDSATEVLHLLSSDNDIGTLVQKLYLPRIESVHLVKPIIERQLVELLQKLPNLFSLELFSFCLNYDIEGPFEIGFSLPILAALGYCLETEDSYRELDILRELLEKAVNLSSLTLIIREFPNGFFSIEQCATLNFFKLKNHSRFDILDPDKSLLPHSSISRLKEFIFNTNNNSTFSSPPLLELIQRNSTTLEHLSLEIFDESFQYVNFTPLLCKIDQLRTFGISSDSEAPIDLLQFLPSTIQSIDVPISRVHLEHLRLNPRPIFSLKQISFSDLEYSGSNEEMIELIQLLPKQVEIVRFSAMSFQHLDYIKENWKPHPDSFKLKQIVIEYVFNTSNNLNRKEYYITEFRKLGIKLEILNWNE